MHEVLPYIVEPMTLADIDQVMMIERIAFPAPWSMRAYRYEVAENENSTMVVVRPALGRSGPLMRFRRHLGFISQGPILGYGGFWLLVDEAHVCTIAVHPRWRGRGLGELLLLSLLEQGMALGAVRSTLEVRVSNWVAQKLYRKCGFELMARQKRYYTNNNEDAYIMATPPFETPGFQTHLSDCRSQLYARLQRERTDIPGLLESTATPIRNLQTG